MCVGVCVFVFFMVLSINAIERTSLSVACHVLATALSSSARRENWLCGLSHEDFLLYKMKELS